ncbi:MAG: porin family protein [Proteobacteria bacterium]|nr:porin family protein [Pseudomonadota bacterium]
MPQAAPGDGWQGFYLGGHAGAFTGTASFSDPDDSGLFGGSVTTPGLSIGLQAGYNWLVGPQWLVGLEGSASYLTSQGHNTCLQPSPVIVGSDCKASPQLLASLTGRLGYLTEPRGRTLLYGKAGVAWMRNQLSVNPNNTSLDDFELSGDRNEAGDPISQFSGAWGWTVGAGVEYAMTRRWSLSVEYDYFRFGNVDIAKPQTISVTPTEKGGHVTTIPADGVAGVTQDLHFARIGLNYRWGVGSGTSAASADADTSATASWIPGWEFETGIRYWYSSGNFQSANGSRDSLVSRLPYNGMEGHSGEVFGRLDSPFDVFFKGFVGGGGITAGTMYDEDWGLAKKLSSAPTGYEITQSGINGSFTYLTADVGYNVLRGPDHKVGFFIGYNRYQTVMNTQGCTQLVYPTSGVCVPTIPDSVNAISEIDTWHSLRLGVSTQARLWDRFRIDVDLAYLPYVYVDALDIHRVRETPLSFPAKGTGNGVQGELIFSYQATDAFSIGVGGRYWSMWTNNAYLSDGGNSFFTLNTDRYGVFLQLAYRFKTPKQRQ